MRLVTIILLISFNAEAAKYYVANNGNNALSGTSTATAWQTIVKATSSITAGDSVLLRAGDTWNEKVLVPFGYVYFGSYGTGERPLITALTILSGFAQSGNIWTITASAAPTNLNTVYIDGKLRAKGRYPNFSYLTYKNTSTKSKIVSDITYLPESPNFTGAEAVVNGSPWVQDIRTITSQVNDSLFLSSATNYMNSGSSAFFIQNYPSLLDLPYEWAFNSTTKVLSVYSTSSPVVKVSVIDTLINITKKDYVTFDGIAFEGANMCNINADTSAHLSIINCTLKNTGGNAIQIRKSDYLTVRNDSIYNSLNGAIFTNVPDYIFISSDYAVVDNNYIKNTGYIAGMGKSGDHAGIALYLIAPYSTITNNQIDSTGYIPINYAGKKCLVKNNVISNFCFIKDDGGAIYTWVGNGYYPVDFTDSSIIRKNIIYGGIGAQTNSANGIYMDNYTRRQIIDSNTVIDVGSAGIVLQQASENKVMNNNIYTPATYPIYISNKPSNNNTITNNTVYSSYPSIVRVNFSEMIGYVIDSNHYINPSPNKFNIIGTTYSFSSWKAATGYDANSDTTSPSNITSSTPYIFFNPTSNSGKVPIAGNFTDYSTQFYQSAYIEPHYSKILFKIKFHYSGRIGSRKFRLQ